MLKAIRLLTFLLLPASVSAQLWNGIISSSRAADWTQVGAGTIPTNRTQCSTVAAYGSSGSPQPATTINNAISSCGTNQYVQLGTGTFWLNSQIVHGTNNVTLRGNGPNNTIINFGTLNANCAEAHPGAICIAGGDDSHDGSNPTNISNVTGLSQGSTTMLLGTQTTGSFKPVVGQIIELNQAADGSAFSSDTWPAMFTCTHNPDCTQNGSSTTAADGSPFTGLFQIVVVNSITAGTCTDASPCTVGISPPIHAPNWGTASTRAWWETTASATGIGVEALQINGLVPTLAMRWCAKCWIKNVELTQGSGNSGGTPKYITINHSTLWTVRDSYVFGQGNWSDEYSIDCYGCFGGLAENNIWEYIRLGLIQEMGAGNAISYNYDIDNAAINQNGLEEGIVNNHGCCGGYILIEGNDAVNTKLDNYYGQSFMATEYRNRYWGKTSLDTAINNGNNGTMVTKRDTLSRFGNILGNVLGTISFHTNYQTVANDGASNVTIDQSIYSLGHGLSGSSEDTHMVASLYRYGNWDNVTNAVRKCASNDTNFASAPCSSVSEVPTGLTNFAQSNPANGVTLPPSFLYSSKPAWFGVTGQAAIPWPAIGPDVGSGNLANSGGFANKIPARLCFETVMGGSFSDTAPRTFNADSCYTTAVQTGPSAPCASCFTLNVLPLPAQPPVPTLTNISPANTYLTASGFSQDGKVFAPSLSVTATGTNFTSGTICTLDGTPVTCTCASSSLCTITVPATMLTAPAVKTAHQIKVANPAVAVPAVN